MKLCCTAAGTFVRTWPKATATVLLILAGIETLSVCASFFGPFDGKLRFDFIQKLNGDFVQIANQLATTNGVSSLSCANLKLVKEIDVNNVATEKLVLEMTDSNATQPITLTLSDITQHQDFANNATTALHSLNMESITLQSYQEYCTGRMVQLIVNSAFAAAVLGVIIWAAPRIIKGQSEQMSTFTEVLN